MHRGFKLKSEWYDESYYQMGIKQYIKNQVETEKLLETFIGPNRILNGTKLQNNWFPMINADIFISHSHRDLKKAISLAGWIETNFKLKVFIDSCIWGYAEDLLKLIDNDYCRNTNSNTYDYEKRNQSTSHVHMMLSVALGKMIDNTECLFFLNTPNSIKTSDSIDKTQSPWIYNEIAISTIIKKRKLGEYRHGIKKSLYSLRGINESVLAEYEVNLGHLQEIDINDLYNWINNVNQQDEYPLDKLYALFPINPA